MILQRSDIGNLSVSLAHVIYIYTRKERLI